MKTEKLYPITDKVPTTFDLFQRVQLEGYFLKNLDKHYRIQLVCSIFVFLGTLLCIVLFYFSAPRTLLTLLLGFVLLSSLCLLGAFHLYHEGIKNKYHYEQLLKHSNIH